MTSKTESLLKRVGARIPASVTPATRIEIHPSEWIELANEVADLRERLDHETPARRSEEDKLVEFFRSTEGAALGRDGDYDNLSPAQTAIRAMRKLLKGAPENRGPSAAPGGVGVIDLAARSPLNGFGDV